MRGLEVRVNFTQTQQSISDLIPKLIHSSLGGYFLSYAFWFVSFPGGSHRRYPPLFLVDAVVNPTFWAFRSFPRGLLLLHPQEIGGKDGLL